MNNQILAIIIVPIGLLAAMWATSSLLTIPETQRVIFLVAAVLLLLPLLLYRRLAYDLKFLMLLMIGYAIAGKGFAYLSPMPPVYIGEIALGLCLLGFLIRQGQRLNLFPSKMHFMIFAFMAVAGASLLVRDYSNYKMLALRDSSIAYYGLFFFCAFGMLNTSSAWAAIRKCGSVMLWLWAILTVTSLILEAGGINGGVQGVLLGISPILAFFYQPHGDISFPLAATLAVVCISKLLRDKKFLYLFPLILALVNLAQGKAAGLFAFVVTCVVLIFFAKRTDIGLFGGFAGLVAGLVIAISVAIGMTEYLEGVDLLTTVDQGFKESSGGGYGTTSDWRMTWWATVWNDTMATNPVFGAGLGGDISTPFLEEMYGVQSAERRAHYARYPHNVIFTIVGRLGLLGLAVFMVYIVLVVRYLLLFCRYFLRNEDYLIGDILFFSLFCSGFANAFVQATYEAPYAAIIHWVSLAYLVRRIYDYGRVEVESTANAADQRSGIAVMQPAVGRGG